MYLVTGATGFIGKHLIDRLILRGQPIRVLVRPRSRERWDQLVATRWPGHASLFEVVEGDIAQPGCGLAGPALAALKGAVQHVFHLAAIYDLAVDLDAARAANVEGSRHATEMANQLGARLHYVSSIAVGGTYRGSFREDMFDEGQSHPNAYFVSKFEAEKAVRESCKVPLRIYRPGIVIGSSRTGEADKIDGPYYAFKTIQRLRAALPAWTPMIGIEGGRFHLVPVDYVAAALDHIAHAEGLDGRTFHLVDPAPLSFGDALNQFCTAAHAPRFSARIDSRMFNFVPKHLVQMVGNLPPVKSARDELLSGLGLPASALQFVNWRTKFDSRGAQEALAGSGIACPALPSYAWKIWDHWERHLDPDLHVDRTLAGRLGGKVVMVTGASSGIGEAVARRVAAAGATVCLVARNRDKLSALAEAIAADGGRAEVYSADLSSEESCDQLVAQVLADHDRVDVLINNAGRSIRRAVAHSYDRFHDFQRTMALNYFGALKLILGFLPVMRKNKYGHIINVSSMGVQTNVPRFSAYIASKAALDAFSRSIASEVVSDNVSITTVFMPLVRTPMIAPTRIYEAFPAISPDEAADMVLRAVTSGRPKRISTRLGLFGEGAYVVAPKVVDRILNMGYRLFPENKRTAKGETPAQQPISTEAVAFAYLLRGLHW